MFAEAELLPKHESVAEVVSNTAKTIDTSSAEAIAQAKNQLRKEKYKNRFVRC